MSRTPTIKQIAWISVVPQLLLMALTFWALTGLGIGSIPAERLLITGWSYVILSMVLKITLVRNHKRGIALVRTKHFAEAIPWFQSSYAFFNRYPWLDQYRFILLLSSSAISYREMALLNTAYCYAQSGDREQSLLWYRRTQQEFPESEIAQQALQMASTFADTQQV